MSRSYNLYVTDTPEPSEYIGDTPREITHKGKTYKVQHTIVSCDVWGSFVKIFIPIRLPGEKLMYCIHTIGFRDLTWPQRRRFFPRRAFRGWKNLNYNELIKKDPRLD
jgi:hypothetical protein